MVSVNVVGDFCVQSLNDLQIGSKLSQSLHSANFNVINLEAPLFYADAKPICKSGPNLCQDLLACDFLEKCGFNVFTVANNHFMDYGKEAAIKTLNKLNTSVVIGCGDWQQAYQYKILEINGIKISLLSLTQYEFGVLGEKSYRNSFGTAWIGHPCVDELIHRARHDSDFLIILPHIGLEHFDYPLPEVRTLFHHFVDMGADAVIGNHPHVPQPWEYYHNAPIVYSLGNFIFDALKPQNEWWNYGLLANLIINNGKKIELEISHISFNKEKRYVEIVENEVFEEHLQIIKDVFLNEEEYIEIVNTHCLGLEYLYDYYFEAGGYIQPNIRKYLHAIGLRLKEKLFHKSYTKYSDASFINCLRCEPHRWVLSRIYELKHLKK